MDLVEEVVGVQLSKEETKALLRAKVICRELAVKLNSIAIKRDPEAFVNAKKACRAIGGVIGCCGKYFNEGDDAEYDKLDEKDDELYEQGEFEHRNWKED